MSRPWFSSPSQTGRNRAGYNGKNERTEPPRAPDPRKAQYACGGCGAPGKRLCVCDPAYDRLVARVLAAEAMHSPRAKR